MKALASFRCFKVAFAGLLITSLTPVLTGASQASLCAQVYRSAVSQKIEDLVTSTYQMLEGSEVTPSAATIHALTGLKIDQGLNAVEGPQALVEAAFSGQAEIFEVHTQMEQFQVQLEALTKKVKAFAKNQTTLMQKLKREDKAVQMQRAGEISREFDALNAGISSLLGTNSKVTKAQQSIRESFSKIDRNLKQVIAYQVALSDFSRGLVALLGPANGTYLWDRASQVLNLLAQEQKSVEIQMSSLHTLRSNLERRDFEMTSNAQNLLKFQNAGLAGLFSEIEASDGKGMNRYYQALSDLKTSGAQAATAVQKKPMNLAQKQKLRKKIITTAVWSGIALTSIGGFELHSHWDQVQASAHQSEYRQLQHSYSAKADPSLVSFFSSRYSERELYQTFGQDIIKREGLDPASVIYTLSALPLHMNHEVEENMRSQAHGFEVNPNLKWSLGVFKNWSGYSENSFYRSYLNVEYTWQVLNTSPTRHMTAQEMTDLRTVVQDRIDYFKRSIDAGGNIYDDIEAGLNNALERYIQSAQSYSGGTLFSGIENQSRVAYAALTAIEHPEASKKLSDILSSADISEKDSVEALQRYFTNRRGKVPMSDLLYLAFGYDSHNFDIPKWASQTQADIEKDGRGAFKTPVRPAVAYVNTVIDELLIQKPSLSQAEVTYFSRAIRNAVQNQNYATQNSPDEERLRSYFLNRVQQIGGETALSDSN